MRTARGRLLPEILEKRVARGSRRRNFQRVLINRREESRRTGEDRGPHTPIAVDGAEHRHLPALEELGGAGRKVIDDAFADVLCDVTNAGALLHRNLTAVELHRRLRRRRSGHREMMVRLYLQLDEAGRAVVAVAEVAHFAESRIAVVMRVVGADPMAAFAVKRDGEIAAGCEIPR